MYRHTISSRIDYSDPKKYGEIERDFVAAIRKGRTAAQVWDETTSYFVIETPESSLALAKRLIIEARLRVVDLLVVKNSAGPDGWCWGQFKDYQKLKRLMPGIERLVPQPPLPPMPGLRRL